MKNGKKYRFRIPTGSYLSPEQLENGIYNGVIQELATTLGLAARKRRAVNLAQEGPLDTPGTVIEEGEAPVHSQRREEERRRKEAEKERQKAEARRRAQEEAKRREQQRRAEEQRKREEKARQEAAREAERKAAEVQAQEAERAETELKREQERVKSEQENEEKDEAAKTEQQSSTEELAYKPSTKDPEGIAFGGYESIYLVKDKDPDPELRFLHEKDNFIYQQAKEEYLKKYGIKWDPNLRIFPDFLKHVRKNLADFKNIYDRIEFNENYQSRTEEEKQFILDVAKGIQFYFLEDIGRFSLKISHKEVAYVTLTDQICYVLGYDREYPIFNGQSARYMADLHGGVSHLCVYINGGLIVIFT